MKTKFNGLLALLLALVVQISFAQEKTVTGTVADASGPLPGVTVIVKGTNTGTQTDFDGNYSITASPGAILVFSYVGMQSVERTVGASNVIDVAIQESAEALEEVVITSYGITRQKKTLTYQTESMSDEELQKVSPTRAASALAGKVAGLQINVLDNGVNPQTKIILRGLRSVSANNSALVVIDGSVGGRGAFDDLNPNDIKSINILKGATAAALYGSEGANGAIIVTTKSGNVGESFTIGINSASTFEEVAYMPEFQTEYGTGWQGAYDNVENTNWGPRFDGQVRQIGPTFADGTFQAVPYAPVKDNLKDFYETGVTLQNTVYFSGGDENSSYYMSVGDQKTTGIVERDTYRRNTFRVNASKTIGKLKLSLNSNYLRDKTSVVGGSIGDQSRPLYWFVLNTSANIPLSSYKDWEHDLFASPNGYYNAYYQNPYWAIDTNRNDDRTSRLTAGITASYDIKDWLNLSVIYGLNTTSGYGKDWRAKQTYDPATQPSHTQVNSFVIDSEFSLTAYNASAVLTGDIDLIKDVKLNAIIGASGSTVTDRNSSIRADNLSIDGFYDVSNGTGQPIVNVDESLLRGYGYFANLNFGYKDFLFLNAGGRYDYTSTLPAADNSYFYPSLGVSFVASEAFPELSNGALSYLKLTVNNSTVYNDLGPYQINETFGQSNGFPFGSLNGFAKSATAVDAGITKEKITTSEIGANLAFFDNRLTVDAAYFITKSTDLITFTTPSITSGAGAYLTNIGELEGKGFELTLGGTILKTDDFSWDANVHYTSNETTVKSISEGVNEITVTSTGTYGVYAIVGEAFPQIKAKAYERDPQGRIVIDAVSGNPNQAVGLKNLGKTTPDYIIGLTSSINYKNFNLSTTMDYRTGHVYYEQGSDAMQFTGRTIESVSANRQDFVLPNSVVETSPGVFVENTNIPVTGGRQDYWMNTYDQITENYVKDATAFKIRELALNYNLPSSLLDKTPLKTVRIGLLARNILTVLPKENHFSDPEFNNSTGNAIGIGGYFQTPPTRSYGVTVNVEF